MTRSGAAAGLGANLRQYGMIAALLVIVAFFQIATGGRLLLPQGVADLARQNAYVFVLAIGMVIVIVAGHIDLSVGSVVAFVGGVCAVMIGNWQVPWPVAVIASVALGALVGGWHGFWVAYVGIPAFIVTLSGMLIFRGLAQVIAGTTIAGLPNGFEKIGDGSLPNSLGFIGQLDAVTLVIGTATIAGLVFTQLRSRRALAEHGLPVEPVAVFAGRLVLCSLIIGFVAYLLSKSAGTPIVLLLTGGLVLLYTFVMAATVFGRHVYAMGGNLPAAVLSGVKTKRVTFLVFVNMGLLAGVAAVVTTSRAGNATSMAGLNYELDAIAAAFIGGTAVNGGIGRVSGAIVGALIMGVLNMGLSIAGVPTEWQQTIKGLVLLAAVAFDVLGKRRVAAR